MEATKEPVESSLETLMIVEVPSSNTELPPGEIAAENCEQVNADSSIKENADAGNQTRLPFKRKGSFL